MSRRIHVLLASVLVVASLSSFLTAGLALSAEAPTEKFGDLQQAIAELRWEAGQDRRTIVKANMLLTSSEATLFWPLYDEYRDARYGLGDRKVKLISEFLAKRDAMSEDDATALSKESFSIQKDTLSVKEKYFAKMSKTLSARTVARFFQIDQKLDAAVDLELASRIPLVH